MKTKTISLICLLWATSTLSALADDYDLWAAKTDASTVSLGLGTLRSITFELDGTGLTAPLYLVANANDGTVQKLDMASLDYLYFDKSESTGIEGLGSDEAAISCTYADGNLFVRAITGEARVYQTDGRLRAAGTVADGNTPLRVGTLPRGIYLLSINNKTLKFIVP